MLPLEVASFHMYPVKSCAGISLDEAVIGPRGIVGDREFMIVDGADGKMLTQRTHPQLALVRPTPFDSTLLFDFASGLSYSHKVLANGMRREVKVHQDVTLGIDQGDGVAEVLSETLDYPCRLGSVK